MKAYNFNKLTRWERVKRSLNRNGFSWSMVLGSLGTGILFIAFVTLIVAMHG